MGKLCNRNYADDLLLSVKMVNGVATCPSCDKPTMMHGKSIEARALYWSALGDSGTSSNTIFRHMLNIPNIPIDTRNGPPSDASDRGRCIRLLELIPEWIPRLHELVETDKPQDGIVISSAGIHTETNGWAKQVPLILKEGKL